MELIRVLIVDDEPIVRSGMAALLGLEPDIQVVGEAASGAEAIGLCESCRPDVVVMDVRMPGEDGISTTRVLTSADREGLIKVLVVSTFPDDDAVCGALRSGASGFLLKYATPTELATAVRHIAQGDAWIDTRVAATVIAALSRIPGRGQPAPHLVDRLTPREREVLGLMALGMVNRDIAARLFVSDATVKTHVSRILMKTGGRNRADAVMIAYQSGLVSPGDNVPHPSW